MTCIAVGYKGAKIKIVGQRLTYVVRTKKFLISLSLPHHKERSLSLARERQSRHSGHADGCKKSLLLIKPVNVVVLR
uniref:Uncharacterized protein n=1 Tax=Psilocybe cubensis TaxID=181762 RepID=A0A8H7XL77_PSICU